MKNYIIENLKNGNKIILVFNKEFRRVAIGLVDELPSDENSLVIKTNEFDAIVNLSTVKYAFIKN
ncbi:hypothetical protein BG261_02975 [Floricoccus tropicus]|uniref:Uncharacterized protein n=1 Tax=Floricoccus tropicus TaxID=1859473 RepID=A0A1E8GPZ5_9LACT|nr:hypothetical protein [Floricoccus tropicus]OFI49558.1 hypothetical protein BG261_02975 [Floricoccus tropicus]